MKCKSHKNEASAVCSNCGVALCDDCSMQSASKKYCCSENCIQEIELVENIARLTLERATKGSQAGAIGSYLLGVLFLVFAVYGFIKGWLAVVAYMGLFGIGMIIMGYFYQKSAASKVPVNKPQHKEAADAAPM